MRVFFEGKWQTILTLKNGRCWKSGTCKQPVAFLCKRVDVSFDDKLRGICAEHSKMNRYQVIGKL